MINQKITMPPLVSIIMPAYNGESYIAQAIESVLAQTYSDWELIVVNDGSTDKTADIVDDYSDRRIKLVNQANSGEAAARNTALDHVQGEFIAFLDADDMYQPNHLESTISSLQTHMNWDAVYTDGYHIDQNGEFLTTLSTNRRGPFEGHIFEEVVRASDVFGPPGCVVLRSEPVFRNDLRFDTEIVIGPDWDFLTRYAEMTQFGYVNQPTYLYRVHQTNITVRTDSRKRLVSLAKCRSKAIKMKKFEACSLQTREAVFYDLLIELLSEFPEKQASILTWPEFKNLPAAGQARLLRLMAGKTMMINHETRYVDEWLQKARTLNPADRRSLLLSILYRISPVLSRFLLKVKTGTQPNVSHTSPFNQHQHQTLAD